MISLFCLVLPYDNQNSWIIPGYKILEANGFY